MSQAEPENPLVDPDELVEEYNFLREHDMNIVAFRKLLHNLAGYGENDAIPEDYTVIDAANDAIERLERLNELAENLEELEEVKNIAKTALAVADKNSKNGEGMTKVESARINTRDQLIKDAFLGTSHGKEKNITYGRVSDLGKPKHDYAYQTVKDAWDDLETRWACFRVGENEEGNRVCIVNPKDVSEDLLRVVEHSLGRSGLTKRLITETSRKGGK